MSNADELQPAEFRAALRTIFDKEWTPERLRRRWEGEVAEVDPARKALGEVGLAELFLGPDAEPVTEELALVLAEESARALFPLPLVETLVAVGPILTRSGDAVAAAWADRMAAGAALAAVRLDEHQLVPEAGSVDLLLVARGDHLLLVPRDRYEAEPVQRQDRTTSAFAVSFEIGDAHVLDVDPAEIEELRTLMVRMTAARLVGVAEVLLGRTLAYVTERRQFGTPIGSFQAVQHRLADVFVALELARALVHQPTTGRGACGWVDASAAKVQAARAASLANREALQLHGAMGYSWEFDLQFWLKHGKTLEREYGTASLHTERLAAHLLEGASDG